MNGKTIKDSVYSFDRQYDQAIVRLRMAVKGEKPYNTEDKRIQPEAREQILKFNTHCLAEGLSKGRIAQVMQWLLRFSQYLDGRPLDKSITKTDIESIMAKLNNKGYQQSTKSMAVKVLKKYMRWVYGLSSEDPAPEIVRWVKVKREQSGLRASDLLTNDEFQRMLDSSSSIQERAMVSLHYWSGLRTGELLQLRLCDLEAQPDRFIVTVVAGKMEKYARPRTVPVFECYQQLLVWYNHHPQRGADDSAPLFLTNRGRPFNIESYNKIVKKMAKRAGITRRIHPYLFRHTRATALHKTMQSPIASRILGHTLDSKMTAVYVHLDDTDVMRETERLHGIKSHEVRKKIVCGKCNRENHDSATVCYLCNSPLSLKGAMETENRLATLERLMEKLLENQKIAIEYKRTRKEFVEEEGMRLAKEELVREFGAEKVIRSLA